MIISLYDSFVIIVRLGSVGTVEAKLIKHVLMEPAFQDHRTGLGPLFLPSGRPRIIVNETCKISPSVPPYLKSLRPSAVWRIINNRGSYHAIND